MTEVLLHKIVKRVEKLSSTLNGYVSHLNDSNPKFNFIYSRISHYHEVRFWQDYFVYKNLDSAKRNLTLCARINNRRDIQEYMYRPLPGFLHILLCDDSVELEKMKSWKYNLYDRRSGMCLEGVMPIMQMMLAGKTVEAKMEFDHWKQTDIYKSNLKTYIPHTKYFNGLFTGDLAEIKEAIELISSSKMQKKLIKYDGWQAELYSLVGMIWAKTAWILGYEVEIDSSYILMDLMPIVPAEEFEIPYEFLKDHI